MREKKLPKKELLYGLDLMRKEYKMQGLLPQTITIDYYNNRLAEEILFQQKKGVQQGLKTSPEAFASQVVYPEHDEIFADIEISKDTLWPEYIKAAASNKKFNGQSIYEEVEKSYGKDTYHMYHNGHHGPELLYKRGSKLGIEISAENPHVHIHFILDGIDMKAVVEKSEIVKDAHIPELLRAYAEDKKLNPAHHFMPEGPGKSITASELRFLRRNWERLKGRVVFYQKIRGNVKVVEAPWVKDPKLWAQYKPKSLVQVESQEKKTSLFDRIFHAKKKSQEITDEKAKIQRHQKPQVDISRL